MLNKTIRKALGNLYVCETAGQHADNMEIIKKEIEGTSIEFKFSVIDAALRCDEHRRDMYSRKLNEYGGNIKQHGDVINAWTYCPEHGESWTDVYIINANSEEAAERLIGRYTDIDGHGTGSPYDCSGRTFSHAARFREVYTGRWIVTQWKGLDV